VTVQLNLWHVITAPPRYQTQVETHQTQLGTYQTQLTRKSCVSIATACSYDSPAPAVLSTGYAPPPRQSSPGIPSRPASPLEMPRGMHDAVGGMDSEPAADGVGLPVLASLHPRSKETKDTSHVSQYSQQDAGLGALPLL
jgi:hypothetical protein